MIKTLLILVFVLTADIVNAQDFRSVEEAEGLEIGTVAPDFIAVDADNNEYSLNKALDSGPVIIIFYRGHWCPYCNRHLSQIQDSLGMIYEKGATVVAVSPQKPDYLNKTREKSGSEFTLVHDEGYRISDAYNVTFLPESRQLIKYNTFLGAKLKESHSDDSQRLPIPATYVVNQEGIIIWRQFDPDYKNRSSVRDILDALENI